MKKNIIIGILIIITSLSLIFAFMQKKNAEVARMQAIDAQALAEEMRYKMHKQEELATINYLKAKQSVDSLKLLVEE